MIVTIVEAKSEVIKVIECTSIDYKDGLISVDTKDSIQTKRFKYKSIEIRDDLYNNLIMRDTV